MNYRLAYLSDTWVNWCPALGTVLANDEVKDGYSERGGYPVERKKMSQWFLRITAYAQRLLDGLETIDWSESIKEVQRNWISLIIRNIWKFSQHVPIRFLVLPSWYWLPSILSLKISLPKNTGKKWKNMLKKL